MDKEATAITMFGRKQRSRKDKSKDNFAFNINNEYHERKFKIVWEIATTEVQENNCGTNKRNKGHGTRAVAKQYNHRSASPGDRTIKHANLAAQVVMGQFRISPKEMSRPSKIPDVSKKVAALQAVLLQVDGKSEASKQKLMVTSYGRVTKTKREGTFSHTYLFNTARAKYPEIMNLAKTKSHKDCRVEWLSYKNIMDWTNRARYYPTNIDMLSPEPGYSHAVWSNCSFHTLG
jgi:hypothetical protein